MSYINPVWIEGQRKYRLRPDAQRFIRHDAHRFLTPAGQAKRQAREAEAAAQCEAVEISEAEQEEFEREVLRLRWEFKKLKLDYELRCFERKYSPSQPRVPSGSPEGGQWTSLAGAGGSTSETVLDDAGPDSIQPDAQVVNVIPICLLGTKSIGEDRWGNRLGWWAEYTCADGFVFRKSGFGGTIPGFRKDPRY